MFNGEAFEHIERPADMVGVKGAYGVYVVGESMWPRYIAGEIVCVNPFQTPRAGHYVVVAFWNEAHSEAEYVIKEFVSRDERRLKLRQFNPPMDIVIPADRLISVHRIAWKKEAQ